MKRQMVLFMALLLCAGAQAATGVAGQLNYPVLRASAPVTVDGDVAGDPAWQGAPQVTGFSVLGSGYAKAKQTTAQMLWDDKGLYIAVVCEEPDAALLKPSVRDYGDTWSEDSLEIFLQPAGQVYQIGVSAGGAKGSGEGGPEVGKITAAAKIGTDSYSIEVLVPPAVLKASLKSGDKWRGDICRNIFQTRSGGDKFTSWTPLQSRFLEPEHFATLTFGDQTATAAKAAQLTEELNAPYRQTLLTEVKDAASQGAQYREALKDASDDPTFGEPARKLLREWRQIETLSKGSDQANTLEMRKSLTQLQALNEQSYQLKYKYLINKLLSEN